jgi:Domain of unknown function (DUF3883)
MATDYSSISIGSAEELAKRVGDSLLADRYRDPTHFVYELLQNAEDALKDRYKEQPKGGFSRRVRFDLYPDRLEVRHCGIPFGQAHIQAICDIARSSKTAKDDIQHFGIGFKSVYAFTKSPQIHSGDEHFWIESYVKPHACEPRQTGTGETLFVFPFDHSEKEPKECHAEIAARLRDLGLQTILFLRHVDEIDWRIDKQATGRYSRKIKNWDTDNIQRFDLSGEEDGRKLRSESWLVFHRSADFTGREGRTIDVAYRLADGRNKANGHQIKRVKDSRLVALFPTDVQIALGFLIQGPYELTPSRDNLDGRKKAREVNQRLIKETAKFVPETLEALKVRGLLTFAALDALPLEGDAFETDSGQFFAPVFEAVKQALKKRPLIPGVGKSFVSGTNGVLVRGRELADLFKPEQLKLLLDSEGERQWISPEITDKKSTQRLHSYLRDALGVDELDADTLVWRLEDSFLQAQKVTWFARFYRFLLKHESLWSEDGGLRDKPIIRLADGSNVAPFGSDGANAFLPSDGESGPKSVHTNLITGESLAFLRKLGIRERDAVAEVLEDILPQYDSGEGRSERKHKRNLERILLALSDEKSSDHAVLVDKLSNTPFLQAENAKTGKREFQSPSSLLYNKSSELSEYFKEQDDCWFLAEASLPKAAKMWLVKLGVGELPALESSEEVKDRRLQEIAPDEPKKRVEKYDDYDLHGLDKVLKRIRKHGKSEPRQAVQLSRTLWRILVRVANEEDGKFLKGTLKWKRPRGRVAETDHFDSCFIERLRAEAWLPDRKGQLRKPSEMQAQDLASGFERNSTLCDALQFQTPRAEKLKEVGLTPKEIRLLEFTQRYPEAAEEFLRNCRKRNTSSAAASDEQNTCVTPGTADGMRSQLNGNVPATSGESTAAKEPQTEGAPASTKAPACFDTVDLDATAVGDPGEQAPRTDHLQTRVRAVAQTASESTPESQEMAEVRSRIDRAGVAAVKAFEEQAGRSVTEMPHNHPGYDLESRGQSSEVLRYIEVKSTGLDWNGVLLSKTQFQKAQELGDRYWLYVVENAHLAKPEVYPIQNPVGWTEKFVFDGGWKAVSAAISKSSEAS